MLELLTPNNYARFVNATRWRRPFWRILVALVTVSAGLGVAHAQVFFPFGSDHAHRRSNRWSPTQWENLHW